jgi:tetratricopeptide (TPR) repeat protein
MPATTLRPRPVQRAGAGLRTWLWRLGLLIGGLAGGFAASAPPSAVTEAARVERLFVAARQNYLAAQTNALLAAQFGRACFDRAEFATNHTERALLAGQGISACRLAILLQPGSAAAHHYLAMNLGQLARTKLLGALKLVTEMESEFKAARQLDAHLDFAGPDRSLGLLYLQAPGWPTSIGSRTKARQHLRRAVELAPQYPENRLALLEACLRWGDRNGALRELKGAEVIWPIATTNLVGETWRAVWPDWRARLERAKAALEEEPKPQTSPRQRH